MDKRVREFLAQFKRMASKYGTRIMFTDKNTTTMASLGLTESTVHDELMELEPSDYYDGPLTDDHGCAGKLWVFKKNIEGNDIYIKLKLSDKGGNSAAVCLSFHFPEFPMNKRVGN